MYTSLLHDYHTLHTLKKSLYKHAFVEVQQTSIFHLKKIIHLHV